MSKNEGILLWNGSQVLTVTMLQLQMPACCTHDSDDIRA